MNTLLFSVSCSHRHYVCFAELESDVKLHVDSQDVAALASSSSLPHHHHHQQQQQQQQRSCDSSPDDSTVTDPPSGSRSTVSTAGTQHVPQTSAAVCTCTSSSPTSITTTTKWSTSSATPTPAHCGLGPPLYPVYPPYIVMGISVQPFAYPPPQSDPSGAVTGNRKRSGNKLLPPDVKRRSRKQRHRHGDVVSSTTPDSSLLETTSGRHLFPFPVEITSSGVQEEVTSPLCLTVSRDKLVYDSCGALDLTIRK